LVEQGESGDSIFLLLDGVLDVEVDGERIAEIGPGAILGERSQLEGGRRTSTLRAVTPCKVAIASTDQLDPRVLGEVGSTHRREEQRPGS
jgi:CRP-like cAMP-binding protein